MFLTMTSNCAPVRKMSQDKKNIKNIYVHKINSLMKLSKDTQLRQDFDNVSVSHKNKFKKTTSFSDKVSLKQEKNRESAKKARIRKKIYIKMLESQIESFKKMQAQGEKLNEESEAFLVKHRDETMKERRLENMEQDANVDKFLSGDNLGELLKSENGEFEQKLSRRDKLISELYQISTTGLFKKLKQIKNFEALTPILTPRAAQNLKKFQELIQKIYSQNQKIKNQFKKLSKITEETKQLSRSCHLRSEHSFDMELVRAELITLQEFIENMGLYKEKEEGMEDQPQVDSVTLKKQQDLSSNLNLHMGEKLLIRSQLFCESTVFAEEQN